MAHDFQDQLIQFLPKMRVWALALTRNRAAAEDLTQDVATKALVAQRLLHARHQFLRLGASHHGQPLHQRRTQPARIYRRGYSAGSAGTRGARGPHRAARTRLGVGAAAAAISARRCR